MRRIPFIASRIRLLLLVVIIVIPGLVLVFYTLMTERQREEAVTLNSGLRLARIISIQEQDLIEATRELLIGLSHAPIVRKDKAQECSKYLSSVLRDVGHYSELGVVDSQGNVISSAIPFGGRISIADRGYFRAAMETGTLAVGEYQVGRITREPGVNIGYPIMNESGKKLGVVFVALPLKEFEKIEARVAVQLPEGMTLTKIDKNGLVLAQYPSGQEKIGQPISPLSQIRGRLTQGQGIIRTTDTSGMRYLNAYSPIESSFFPTGIALILSIPEEKAFLEVNDHFHESLVLLSITALIVLLAGIIADELFLVRGLKVIRTAALQMAGGNLSARAEEVRGLVEVRELGRTFNEMTDMIERRDADRQKAEESLRESEGRYRALFTCTKDALYVHVDGRITIGNPAFGQLLGADDPSQLLGKSVFEIVHPEYHQKVKERWDLLSRGQQLPLLEEKFVRIDGTPVDVEVSAAAIDWQGSKGVQVIARIITERKRAEEQLRESETKFRAMFEGSRDAIIVSKKGVQLFANPAYIKLFGYDSVEEIVDTPIIDHIAPSHRQQIQEYIERTGAGEQVPAFFEIRSRKKDGTEFDEEVNVSTYELQGEIYSLAIIRDITERKHTEEMIRGQLAFQEFLARLSSEFASSTGAEIDHCINSGLERSCPFLGSEAAWIILLANDGNSYFPAYEWHSESFPGIMRTFQNAVVGSLPWTERIIFGGESLRVNSLDDIPADQPGEREARQRDGVKSDLLAPLHGRGRLIKGLIGARTFTYSRTWSTEDEQRLRLIGDMIANVLERKRSEESLQLSVDQLHMLATRLENVSEDERKSISHEVHDELGQILTAIRLDLATIDESGASDEKLFRSKLKSVTDLTDKAIEAVQEISARLRPEILDYLGLFPAMEWQVDEFQKHSNVACELHIPEKEPEVDSERSTVLFRILQEALTNVARHAKARKVEITFSESENDFELSVADDGVGITEDRISNPTSFGLLGIKERLHPFKGTCTIKRRSEGGTEINIRLPKHL